MSPEFLPLEMSTNLNVSIDAAGDNDVLLRPERHALDRVIVGLEEVELKPKNLEH